MARMVVFVATDLLYSPIKQDTKGKTTPWLPLATATIYYLSGIWHHYTVLKLDILSPRRRLVGFAFHLYDQRTRNQETSGTMPPVMRKPHRKSRNGCINCKKRKVKCDEQKPICMNCTRHELNCAYEVISRPHNSTSPVAVSPAVSGATPRSMDSQTSTLAPSPMSHGLSSCTLNMDHLELLYNFCLSTSYTLSCNEALKTLWQTSVVKVAFSCDFVMHSVLALSALHMAYLKPAQQQYHLNQAMDLHHAALSKGSPALSDVTSENCEALYLFSALTCFFALARPREPTDFLLEKNTPLSEWLLMFRGTRIVIESSNQPILHAGPLGPMFAIGGRRAQMQVASLTQIDHLWMLQRFINGTACSQEDLRVYNRAVDELRQAYNVVYNEHPEFCETTDVFLWLYRVSEDYLSLLSNRKAEALSIFAYFCVLLKRLDAKWWTQGWSTHLIAQIYQVLDAEHRLWIVWPMREIGWVP